MNADLRGLIQELCAIPEVVVNPDYDALRRRADAALSVAQGQGFDESWLVHVGTVNRGTRRAHVFWHGPHEKWIPDKTKLYRIKKPAAPAQPDGVSKGPVFSSIERDSPYCED